jgi:hypothetical protein
MHTDCETSRLAFGRSSSNSWRPCLIVNDAAVRFDFTSLLSVQLGRKQTESGLDASVRWCRPRSQEGAQVALRCRHVSSAECLSWTSQPMSTSAAR